MELLIMLVTLIFTAVSTTIFIKAEVKKNKEILVEKELHTEKRFAQLENKQLMILSQLNSIEKDITEVIIPLRKEA